MTERLLELEIPLTDFYNFSRIRAGKQAVLYSCKGKNILKNWPMTIVGFNAFGELETPQDVKKNPVSFVSEE